MVVKTTKEFMEAVYKRDWSKGRALVFRGECGKVWLVAGCQSETE